jgi:hypothetical protein
MVWARTKLVIQDDLLRPRNRYLVEFRGLKPDKFYHALPKIFMAVFRADEHHLQEKKISWTHGETEKFKVAWEGTKELDSLSYFIFNIELSGSQSKGSGEANVLIEGYLRTEYPQDTVWEKSILYEMLRIFWHKSFYIAQRGEYMNEGRREMAAFVEEIKKLARASDSITAHQQ